MSIIISKTKILATAPVPIQTWDRPSDWLDMPTLVQGDEEINYLVKVYEEGENYLQIKVVGDYTVNWGDGTTTNYTSNTIAEHSFDWVDAPTSSLTSDGFRQVIVKVTPQTGSTLTGITRPGSPYHAAGDTSRGGNNSVTSVKMAGTGFTSLYQGFYHYTSLEEFEYVGTTPNLVTASYTFVNCNSLKKVIQWDISNVTNLTQTFNSCYSLVSLCQLDTSSCSNFSSMFINCFNIDYIPPMDASGATSLISTFSGCRNLKVSPISDFTNITSLYSAFTGTAIKSFTANLPNVTTISRAFLNCPSLESVKLTIPDNQLLSMENTFSSCRELKVLKPFDTSAVTDFGYAFRGLVHILDYGWVDTSSGVSFTQMFYSNSIRDASFLNITNSATAITFLFANCFKLEKYPATIDCTNITSLYSVFSNNYTLTKSPDFTNTGNITNTYQMFSSCFNLLKAPTINGTIANAQQMFLNCKLLEKIPAYNLSGCNSGNETYQFALGAFNLRESLVTGNTSKISYQSTALNTTKIAEILTNLGNIPSGTAVVNVSNCPGSAGLTTAQEDIAITKGWTVTN